MSYSMNGDYRSLAEAVDGPRPESAGWVPGVDFDPGDAEEMEVMADVFDRERQDTITRLTRDNDRLRRVLAQLTGNDEGNLP